MRPLIRTRTDNMHMLSYNALHKQMEKLLSQANTCCFKFPKP